MVFYEAPHKLLNTLRDLLDVFGDRSVTLCRELTKIHEEVTKTTLSEALLHYEQTAPRGEFVLVIAGAQSSDDGTQISLEDAVELAKKRIEAGERAADVCKEIAAQTGIPKRTLYTAVTQG